MSLNSSLLPDKWCSMIITSSNSSKKTSVYYQVTLTGCVVTSLLAPMAVAGNAFILAAIWKNPSLRTASYVHLAGLAFTDFFTGLFSQLFYVVYKLAELAGERKVICIADVIAQITGNYFPSLPVIAVTIIAMERWLYMSRRSLLTALRQKPNIRARIRSNTDRRTPRIPQCSDVFDCGWLETHLEYSIGFRLVFPHSNLILVNDSKCSINKTRQVLVD